MISSLNQRPSVSAAPTQPLDATTSEPDFSTVRAQLKATGLTPTSARALWLVHTAHDPIGITALAAQLHTKPPNASLLVNGLERLNLAQRTLNPLDRRRRCIELTSRDRHVLQRLHLARKRESPST